MKNKKNDIESFGTESPFSVPENYFEDFSVGLSVEPESNRRTLKQLTRPILAAAAVFGGLIITSYFFFTIQNVVASEMEIAANNKELYEELLIEEFDELQLEDIIAEVNFE